MKTRPINARDLRVGNHIVNPNPPGDTTHYVTQVFESPSGAILAWVDDADLEDEASLVLNHGDPLVIVADCGPGNHVWRSIKYGVECDVCGITFTD